MNGRDLPAGVYRKRPDGGLLVVKVSLPEKGQVYVGCFRTVEEATSARDDALRNGVSSDRKGARKKPQGRPVRDLQETWQRWANRKLVYHLASCPENEPWSIMDAPIVTMGGSRLHWYVRHGYSPLSFLARHDPALFSKVLPCGSDLHGFVVADAEEACATREGR